MEQPQFIYKSTDYKTDLKPVWCPGCGDFGVLGATHKALAELQIPPENIMFFSGIGCSSRFPGYTNTYGFNAIHGRAIPLATGAKIARPELTVVAVGGDGDGYSIGGGHLPHVARKNIDLTYLVMNNNIYGLTKGQASPTTPTGSITKTTPYGNMDSPVNPIHYALAYNASFIARGYSANMKHLVDLIVAAIKHPGFAIVDIISPCVTFRGDEQYKTLKDLVFEIPESHDKTDKVAAFHLALERDDNKIPVGIYYQNPRPTYHENYDIIREKAKKSGKNELTDIYNLFQA